MKTTIPFVNKILALFLSLIFTCTFLVSLFTLPVELVLFNEASYKPLLEDQNNLSIYPEVISDLFVDQLLFGDSPNQEPKLFSNHNNLKDIIRKEITFDWSLYVFSNLTEGVLGYLNFKKPNLSLNIDISQLKTALLLKSNNIASEYLNSLPRCTNLSNGVEANQENVISEIFQLLPCKPSEDEFSSYTNMTSLYIEDKINQLPQEELISGNLGANSNGSIRNFIIYSIARWLLRLMPLIAISFLIAIVLLLQSNKSTSRSWVGKLLVYASVIGLVGFLTLLIGFDQFIVISFNRLNIKLIEGFDVFLLGIIQKVGYATLLWVVISDIGVLVFGSILLLVSRFLNRPSQGDHKKSNEGKIDEREIEKETLLLEEKEIISEKEIKPETIEEIEEQEKKNKKEVKKRNN